jgi:hypothetical protein
MTRPNKGDFLQACVRLAAGAEAVALLLIFFLQKTLLIV